MVKDLLKLGNLPSNIWVTGDNLQFFSEFENLPNFDEIISQHSIYVAESISLYFDQKPQPQEFKSESFDLQLLDKTIRIDLSD